MKIILVALTMLTLNACSSIGMGSKETRSINNVACSGTEHWTDCDAKAKQMCPNGFDVGQKDESLIAQRRRMSFYCK